MILTDKRDVCGCHKGCIGPGSEPECGCEKPCIWPLCLTDVEMSDLLEELDG